MAYHPGTLIDARFTALRGAGFTGSGTDMLFAWLKAHGSASAGTVSDAWDAFLTTQGFAPIQSGTRYSVQDRKLQWLRSISNLQTNAKGTALADLEREFWNGFATYHP